jgi:hypothetical protein
LQGFALQIEGGLIMGNALATLKAHKPLVMWKKSKAAHTRALGASMANIPFMGDATGTHTLGRYAASSFNHTPEARRAILWAAWKAKRDFGLPDDLTGFDAFHTGNTVTFTPCSGFTRSGWQTVQVTLPDWQEALEPEVITIEAEPIEVLPEPCPETIMIEFKSPGEPAPISKPARKPRTKFKIIYMMGKPLRIPALYAA